MSYNVHSCVGTDGRADPARVAGVIAEGNPDVVALQELDQGLERTGRADQAKEIAAHLAMSYHFQPCLSIEQGYYGNAVLSRHPMKMIKAAELPTLPSRRPPERRGAIWVEVSVAERRLQLINTHLGLNRHERAAQAETLLSTEWLRHPGCLPPVLLCGDFNIIPLSRIYQWLTRPLRDAFRESRGGGSIGTYPSRIPLLRLDYFFCSPDIHILSAEVRRNPASRISSDHLPVVVMLELP